MDEEGMSEGAVRAIGILGALSFLALALLVAALLWQIYQLWN